MNKMDRRAKLRPLVLVPLAATLLAFVSLLVLGIVWLYRLLDVGRVSAQVEVAAKAYRAHHMPWTAADLQPAEPVTDAENAGPMLTKAFALIRQSGYRRQRAGLEKAMESGDDAALKQGLVPTTEALSLAEIASRKPKLDFHRDWDLAVFEKTDGTNPYRDLTYALAVRATTRAHNGDKQGAVQDLQTAWKMSSLLGQEPTMRALLAQGGSERIVLLGMERVIAADKDDPQVLAELKKMLDQRTKPSLCSTLREEAYEGVAAFRNLSQSRREDEPPTVIQRDGYPTNAVSRAFLARHLELWTKIADLMDRYGDRDPVALAAAIEALAKTEERRPGISNMLGPLSVNVTKTYGESILRADAQVAVHRALLEALIYRNKTGHLPARLADLPTQPVDPFTSKPLRMKVAGNSIRIYSLGADGKDNGGKTIGEIRGSADKTARDEATSYPPLPFR